MINSFFCWSCLIVIVWVQTQKVISSELGCSEQTCASIQHFLDSHEYFNEATLQLEDGSIKDSLAFYRAAVRICPACGLYWIKLAEAELKLGMKQEAKARLLEAEKLIKDDLKVKELLSTELNDVQTTPDKWNMSQFPPMVQLQQADFGDNIFGDYPWVIRKAFNVTTIKEQVGYEILKTRYNDVHVDYYPQNMKVKPNRIYHATLPEAIEFLEYPLGAFLSSDVSLAGTYIQWNIGTSRFNDLFLKSNKLEMPIQQVTNHLQLLFDYILNHSSISDIDNYRRSSLFTSMLESFSRKTHWYLLLLGEASSGMFMHTDNLPVASWQMQVEGKKRWVICQPIEETADHPFKNCSYNMNKQCMLDSTCQEVVLEPGDVLYYPANYWHYTSCLSTPTISLSGTILEDNDPKAMIQMIKEECSSNKLGYSFDVTLCELIGKVTFENSATAPIISEL